MNSIYLMPLPKVSIHTDRIRIGPLKQGEKKTIRGRIYLFKGSKEDCLRYFKKDFSNEWNGTAAQQDDPADANKPRR